MTKNHPRVAKRAASDSPTIRYQTLLDAELLPRLERPGRYLGPFEARGIATESAEITHLALLWPSVPESHHTPAGLASVKRALESRSQLPVELVCVPAPDAVVLLADRKLPVFSRPSWIPLGSFDRLLLWIEHPGQLPGVLTLLALGGLARRAAERRDAPELLAAGPAAAELCALLETWCDAVWPIEDPSELAEQLQSRAVPEPVDRSVTALAPIVFGSASKKLEACLGDVPAGEERVRPLLRQPGRGFVRRRGGFGGASVMRLQLLAASEKLRRRLGLLESAELKALCEEALAPESGQLELELCLGLAGETDADRAAIPVLIEQLIALAPRGIRQLRIFLSALLPSRGEGGLADEELRSLLEEIRDRVSDRKLRLQSVSPEEYRVAAALLQLGPRGAGSVEHAHDAGVWHGDVDKAFRSEFWPRLASEVPGSSARESVAGLASPAEAATTGLEGIEALPPTLDANGHPLRDEARAGDRRDRWQRWSSLVPREYQLRLVFEKRGSLRHLSHREISELLTESCRRAGVPLAVAGLVAPRPKMRFGPALPVGVEGLEEFVDLSVTRKFSGALAALNEHLPPGLLVRRARYLPPGAKCAHAPVERACYQLRVPEPWHHALREGIQNFRNRESWCIRREAPGKASEIDLKAQVTRLRTDDGAEDGIRLHFECDLSVEGLKLRPSEVVAALLACGVEDICTLTLRREKLLSRGDEPMGPWRTPMELVDLATHRSRQLVRRYS